MPVIEANLIESFLLLNRFFQKYKLRYCLIGGMAAGYWGEPRFTKDMDFTVVSPKQEDLKELLKKEKFQFEEKGTGQLQVVRHGKLSFIADLIFSETDYQDWVIQRAVSVQMFGVTVPICSAEDLIILKLIANRRQDLLDIENVLKNQSGRLDKTYLGEWMTTWELTDRFKKEFGKLI
jgi:hypothetical protein